MTPIGHSPATSQSDLRDIEVVDTPSRQSMSAGAPVQVYISHLEVDCRIFF